MRSRLRTGFPRAGRVLAVVACAGLLAGTVALITGPWLRVQATEHGGERYTSAAAIDEILSAYRGAPLLTVDTAAVARQVGALPAVERATVTSSLPGQLRVSVVEKTAVLTWLTPAVRLVVAADGSVIGELARDEDPPAAVAEIPVVDDQRPDSRRLTVGDRLGAEEQRMALRLLDLDPQLLGSHAVGFALQVDTEYGFILVPDGPGWRAAFGFFGLDPNDSPADEDARLDRQVTAMRTLFSTRAERAVSWVDVRNPGRVYWTP